MGKVKKVKRKKEVEKGGPEVTVQVVQVKVCRRCRW